MPNDDVINALLDKGASASEVSDQIKDLLFAKSAEKVDGVRPDVANTMFQEPEEEEVDHTPDSEEVEGA